MNTTYRVEVIQAVPFVHILFIVSITMISILLVIQCLGLYENRHVFQFRRKISDRIIIWIMMMNIFGIAHLSLSLVEYNFARSYIGYEWLCTTLVQPFSPMLWVISKQFLYFLLYERIVFIHQFMYLNSRFFIELRRFIGSGIVIMIPLSFYWSFFIVFKGEVIEPEGICAFTATMVAPLIAFAVCDFFMSATMLFLLIYPLQKHIKNMKTVQSTGTKGYHKLMWHNLWISVILTSITFTSMIVMDVLLSITIEHPEIDHLKIYAVTITAIDLVFSCYIASTISSNWIPKCLHKRKKAETSVRVSSN